MHTTSSLIDRVFIKQHMQMNSTCLKLQFQGTRATKLFMGWYSISRHSKVADKMAVINLKLNGHKTNIKHPIFFIKILLYFKNLRYDSFNRLALLTDGPPIFIGTSTVTNQSYFNQLFTSKLNTKKVKQIDELYNKKYRFCGNKVAYGEQLASFNSWKNQYLNHYSRLKGS